MLLVSSCPAAPTVVAATEGGCAVVEASVPDVCLTGADVAAPPAEACLPEAAEAAALPEAAGCRLLELLEGVELPRPELARDSLCLAREKGVVGLVIFSLTRSNVSSCIASTLLRRRSHMSDYRDTKRAQAPKVLRLPVLGCTSNNNTITISPAFPLLA